MRLLCKTSGIDSWNAVDVLTDDGQLQHAHVVNVTHNGYILDFDCPGKRAQFMDHEIRDKLFQCSLCIAGHRGERSRGLDRVARAGSSEKIQVLARTSPNQPWTWYPAKFLSPGLFGETCAFVGVLCGSHIVKDCVPIQAVRIVPPTTVLKARAIRLSQFVLASYTLAQSHTDDAPMPAPLWNIWKEMLAGWSVYPIRHMGNAVVCLTRKRHDGLNSDHVEVLLRDARSAVEGRFGAGWSFSGANWIPPKDEHDVETSEQEPVDQDDCRSVTMLPVELLAEVLQFLDSIDQVQCSRVCTLWNCVLTQDQYSKEIRVSYLVDSTICDPQLKRGTVMLAKSLRKRVTTSTERIIIRRAVQRGKNTDLVDCLRFIHAFGEVKALERKLTVIFDRGVWEMVNRFTREIHSLADVCADVASTVAAVIWKNCTVSPSGGLLMESWEVPVSYGMVNVNSSELGSDLCRMLEAALPTLNFDPATLTAWIEKTANQENSRDRRNVTEVLYDFQNGDEREGIHYRHTHWTTEELRCLDVSKLTKLTLHALHRLMSD